MPGYDPSYAVHSQYADLTKRLDSFDLCPNAHVQSPRDLAFAGFFYAGDEECVRCHYCDLALELGDLNQQPLQEHVHHNPSCSHVLYLLSAEVIHEIKLLANNDLAAETSTDNGLDCTPPDSPCLADPSRGFVELIPLANASEPERNTTEENGQTSEKQTDEEDSARSAASEKDSGERGGPSSDPLQWDSDPPMAGLPGTLSDTDEGELSELPHEIPSAESKTVDWESREGKDGNGKEIETILSVMVKKYVRPLDIQGDDQMTKMSHMIEYMLHFPRMKSDDANESVAGHLQKWVKVVPHGILKAMSGFKHFLNHRLFLGWRPLIQTINVFPVVPQSTEEGLARVDFRSPDQEHMHVEGFRVGTFFLYPRADEHAVLRLANAGFYYTGRDDTLACFCCGVTFTYGDRRPDQDPYDIHRRLNPNCPHLTGGDTRNVFIQDEQTHATSGRDITGSVSQPLETEQLSSQVRQNIDQPLQSFIHACNTIGNGSDLHHSREDNQEQSRPEPADLDISPQGSPRMAPNTERTSAVAEGSQAPTTSISTGYNEVQESRPKYMTLRQREASFRRWPHTTTHSPEEMAMAGFFFTGNEDCVRCQYCGLGLKNWEPDDIALEEHFRWRPLCPYLRDYVEMSRREVAGLMTSEYANTARAMGFSDDIIEKAIGALLDIGVGRRAVTLGNLVRAIIYLQERERDLNGSHSCHRGQTPQQTLQELERENQELRERRRCKVCLDNDVNIVFLPCGHLLCCAECAPALKRCPMCRTRILGTVRTYIS